MYNQNRIYRVFQLINYLKSNPPKSVRSIMKYLDTSERTVYRYIEMLKDLGFDIEKDNSNRLWISSALKAEVIPFTSQEADFLEKLTRSSGRGAKIADSVLQKIRVASELNVSTDLLFKAHLGQIVEQISIAITEGRQILIRNYASANSQTISDRIVEPMCFTANYESVSVFEPKTNENKYFNIERMGSVEVLDSKMKHEDKHEFFKPDVFGFQGKSMNKEVELNLSLTAALMLKEEYPMTVPYIKQIIGTPHYHFKTKVQSFLAPSRFVLGFRSEVEVVGSKEFEKYIDKKLGK